MQPRAYEEQSKHAVDRGALDDGELGRILRAYFRENQHVIWRDAVTEHEFL
jgi:hypothetical protein